MWVPANQAKFVRAKCRPFGNGGIWQPGIIPIAYRRGVDCIVYLGNPRFPATWISAVLARILGKRVLFWTIGWYREDSRLTSLIKWVFLRIPHGLLLYGHGAKCEAIRFGLSAQNLYVVHNSLDYDKQKQIRNRVTAEETAALREKLFGERSRIPVAVCVSRLIAKRRLDVLIEAASLNRARGHEINLLLVGDGPEEQNLRELCRQRGVTAHFYGPCFDEESIARIFLASTVTVAPGMVGLLAMHSFAYGVPVLTHNDLLKQSPESEAVVPGFNGDLFGYENATELAECLRKWTETQEIPQSTRENCYSLLDRFYNPRFQVAVILRAVAGQPADDLFWLKGERRSAMLPADEAARIS